MKHSGIMRRATVAIGLAVFAMPGVAAPAASIDRVAARPAVAPPAPALPDRRPTADEQPGAPASGWLIAAATFGLLGLAMRPRRLAAPHAIG